MKFIDEVDIHIKSGNGGHGQVSFRREKFVPRGGPDGGHGGAGGDVLIEATQAMNTLAHYRGAKNHWGEDGTGGQGCLRNGRAGKPLVLKVPVGTVVCAKTSGEVVADLREHGQRILVARGGRGGLGNSFFKSSTNRSPHYGQKGNLGVELFLHLELKLLADLALVGRPNAGKSTLLSVLSSARPKVADYPFTTLEPQLGMLQMGDRSLTLADIPGLVEMAHQGRGLGVKFLRHIERTRALVHLVDISWCEEPYDAFEQYVAICEELTRYGEVLGGKRELVCLTKIDALNSDQVLGYQDFFQQQLAKKVLPISAVSGKNITALKNLMLKMVH